MYSKRVFTTRHSTAHSKVDPIPNALVLLLCSLHTTHTLACVCNFLQIDHYVLRIARRKHRDYVYTSCALLLMPLSAGDAGGLLMLAIPTRSARAARCSVMLMHRIPLFCSSLIASTRCLYFCCCR